MLLYERFPLCVYLLAYICVVVCACVDAQFARVPVSISECVYVSIYGLCTSLGICCAFLRSCVSMTKLT